MNKLFSYIENKPWHVITVLFIFHVSIATVMSWLAYSPYLSSLHNGAGFWKFSIDATLYHKEAVDLVAFLESGLWGEWWNGYNIHKHVKFIALVYWLSGEANPVYFELVNSCVWIMSVVLIYNSSYYLFDKKVKIACVTSLFMFFPSVLISSMQILRDQFYILGFCFIIYGLVTIYINGRSWLGIAFMIIGYGLIISMRAYITPILLYVFIPWMVMLLVTKKVDILPTIVMIFAIGFMTLDRSDLDILGATTLGATTPGATTPGATTSRVITLGEVTITPKVLPASSRAGWLGNLDKKIAVRLSTMRSGFSGYVNASGSSIDADAYYSGIEDVILFLPRAIQIGFLSPFPQHWISEGKQTGRVGRLIAGLETLIMYIVFTGFFWALFIHWERLYALMPILLVSGIIVVLLGFVVPNVGTIYRMRQGLLIPFYMVGVYGVFMMHYYYRMKSND